MENEIYNEANGLWYEKQGYYYLPCVELPKETSLSVYGSNGINAT